MNVISLDEALLGNRSWVNAQAAWVGRKAPPASEQHVLENLFNPELYQKNLKEISSHWTRLAEDPAFYEGTKVHMLEKSIAGQYAITYVMDKASLVHPEHLIAEGVGSSWWVIKNGQACPSLLACIVCMHAMHVYSAWMHNRRAYYASYTHTPLLACIVCMHAMHV